MTYFRYFETINYRFGDNNTTDPFQNISLYSTILDQIKDESTAYRLVQIRDGERPDVLSQRLYGTPDFHWSFYLLNQKIRDQGWPLSQQDLFAKMEKDIPGECIVSFGSTINDNGNKQHNTVGCFPIGTNVIGTSSGATGTVYAKNPLLGQVFINKTNNISFIVGENIQSVASPLNSVEIGIVHDPAYFAIRSVEDGNGNNIDVDYSVDFRTINDGGVFDDPTNRNIYSETNPYSKVTFYEYYVSENDNLSRIKTLIPSVATQVNKLLRESLNNG